MTLDEYLEKLANDIARFKADWQKGNKSDPENWPMDMTECQWDEQFLSYFYL